MLQRKPAYTPIYLSDLLNVVEVIFGKLLCIFSSGAKVEVLGKVTHACTLVVVRSMHSQLILIVNLTNLGLT